MSIHIISTPFEGELHTPFTFPLDNFQKHSIKLLQNDDPKNILVTAHTGSGKSLVAEFAILRSHEKNKKIIYTSPIKVLSNQKFYEFTKKFPDITIGLITGDHKCNPDADCLIMTTEILCQLLEKKSLKYEEFEINDFNFDNIFGIVFDEVHYINDIERGGVWEKCIMNIPKHINQIMLSATIDKAENFINWIYSCNQNPSYLLTNDKRVVPLHFNYSYWVTEKKISKELEQYPNKLNTFTAFTNTNNTHIDTYHIQTMNTLNRLFKDIKVNQTYILNEICKQLEIKSMLPALFFIFSKKRCMELAKNITMTFNDYNEGVEVNRAFDYYLSKLENKEGYKNSYEYNHIKDLALKGIGIHHAGLIPVFKEMIEMLFSKNLIKVLFATETFAVGLNSPIKTVIFSDIYKYDNSGKRRLLTHEFIQMSGRAGRRGIDTIGYVILIPQLFTEETSGSELESLIYGKSQKITSKFNINTDLILDILEDKKIDQLKENIQKSLLNAEIQKDLKNLTDELSIIDNKIKKIVIDNLSIYEEYQVLEDKLYDIIKPSQNQIKKIEQKIKDMKKDPIFIKEFDKYKEYILLKKEYKKVEMYYKGTNDYIDSRINSQINILVKGEYITKELELTQKGQIAIKINEVNPLVLADILISGYLDDLFLSKKLHKIVALFTLVCDGKNDDYIEVLEEYHDVIKFLNQFDILINRELLNPILDWYDGKNSREIVIIYEIHEGDLIKCINKIIHLLDEVINVFLLLNKIEYIEIIKEIKNKLNRDIIKMESLYLKIV